MGRHRVAILVLGGTFVLDLAVAVQAFGRRPSVFAKIRHEPETPYDIVLCGSATVPTSLGFTHRRPASDRAGQPAPTPSSCPGSRRPGRRRTPRCCRPSRPRPQRGARLVSLCAGAFVLGQAGVLDGRRVTTHWALAEEFRAAFPRAHLMEHAMYVDDGQILSSGGMLAATDLCLYLLGQDHGQAYANDVSRMLISPPHRTGGQAQYAKARARAGVRFAGARPGMAQREHRRAADPGADRGAGQREPADVGAAVPGRGRRQRGRLDRRSAGRARAGTAGGLGSEP